MIPFPAVFEIRHWQNSKFCFRSPELLLALHALNVTGIILIMYIYY